ncbi:MAG TPA: anti-sigma factor [Aliidongia sp.]|uniref:anti-sigma factor family protein n=1 Tax=Aliidongia sp. TaxID=1914230 RepID=UPI002DDD9FC7|nr:anti-sigma factor [Aliidongia sp.]HEV2676040.1 anti-sigma factor [Aliidongia sp.]
MSAGRPITEEDLQAYIDRQLDAARVTEVDEYLTQHPIEAGRIAGYGRDRDVLRAALAPFAEEPIPPELNLGHMIEARRAPQRQSWRTAAAAAVLLMLGGLGGWTLSHEDGPAPGGIASLAQEAAESYMVYAPDHLRPVELRADDRGELVHWVSERLQHPVAVPDLASSGYRFMGGRLVPTPHGPAALFLYDDDHGVRLAMLVRPMTIERDMPLAEHSHGAINGFAWSDRGLGYSLVASASAKDLQSLAVEAKRQTAS